MRGRGSLNPPLRQHLPVAAGLQTRLRCGPGALDPGDGSDSRRPWQGSSLRRPVLGEESAQTYKQAGFGRPCHARRSLAQLARFGTVQLNSFPTARACVRSEEFLALGTARWPMMSGESRRSLAAWREAHGFGILCIVGPEGERFLVGPDESQVAAGSSEHDPASWTGLTDAQLRQHLVKERGFSLDDAEDAIQLCREWATMITGSSVFPAPPKPH